MARIENYFPQGALIGEKGTDVTRKASCLGGSQRHRRRNIIGRNQKVGIQQLEKGKRGTKGGEIPLKIRKTTYSGGKKSREN